MEKECPNCLNTFTPNHGKQKFCSDKCKVAFSRKEKQSAKEPAVSKLEEIEDLKLENQKLRMKLLEAQGEIVKLTAQLAEKTKTGATIVQNVTQERPKSNFTINTKKDNYDPFKNPLFNSKNKTKTAD